MEPHHQHRDHDDTTLMTLCRQNDSGAIGELYRRHSARALAFAASMPGCDADDAVSEAFIGIIRLFQNGAGPSENFMSYLMMAVRNAHVSAIRREARYFTVEADYFDTPTDVEADAPEKMDIVRTVFEGLPPRERTALWMTIVDGYSLLETGDALSTTPVAAGALTYRARKRLTGALHAAGCGPVAA